MGCRVSEATTRRAAAVLCELVMRAARESMFRNEGLAGECDEPREMTLDPEGASDDHKLCNLAWYARYLACWNQMPSEDCKGKMNCWHAYQTAMIGCPP